VIPFCSSQAEEQSVLQQESAEALFLQWVNEARANPWAEAERLGLNVTELREQVGESVASQWDEGLPPLEWNEQLALAATCHVQDMLDRVYYSHVSPEGVGPEQRIRSAFYDPIFYGESLGGVAFTKVISAEKASHIIYEGLLMDALCQGSEGAPLLDPLLRDIGLYLGGGQLLLEDSWYNVYILTCDLGRMHEPVSDGQGILWGHVFKDLNGNGRYDQGEGIPGLSVVLQGPLGLYGPTDPVQYIPSLREGNFMVRLPAGTYRLTLEDGGAVLGEPLEIILHRGTSERLDICLPGD
jgi:hypothetical protein